MNGYAEGSESMSLKRSGVCIPHRMNHKNIPIENIEMYDRKIKD